MFAQTNRSRGATVMVLVVAFAMLAVNFEATEGVSLPTLSGSFVCVKDYLINLVRDKIISKSELVPRYQEAMNRVQERFETAEEAGELNGMDDKEKENYYLKLTVEEMRKLRESIAADHSAAGALDLSEAKACMGKTDDDVYNPDAEVENWSPDDKSLEDDKEIEAALMTELEELERQANREDEMGWSLSPEAKTVLKEQTRSVLVDLMNNEARQIATTILSAYLSGGSSLMSILAELPLNGLKFKLAQFLINAITHVASSVIGRPSK